jgi:hypothetical protein
MGEKADVEEESETFGDRRLEPEIYSGNLSD